MKKLSFFIVVFILFSFMILYNNNINYSVSYTKPSFIIYRNNNDLRIGDIINYNSNSKFLIAQRITTELYECINSSPVVYLKEYQYLIIDKSKDLIYTTTDKELFKKKLIELDAKMSLTIKADFSKDYLKSIEESKNINLNSCEDTTFRNFIKF